VVLVADIDCLSAAFLQLRAEGSEDRELSFNFDNVTFVLNTLDSLAGDDRFIDIRARRRKHRTLTEVEDTIKQTVAEIDEKRQQFHREFERKRAERQERFDEEIAKIEKNENLSDLQKFQQIQFVRSTEQRKLDTEIKRLESERDREIRKENIKGEQSIRKVRNFYKYVAVILPPIFPLLIGVVVFFNRRAKEREGVPQARFRQTKAGG
jgi:ABC-2 type transport system permease protein